MQEDRRLSTWKRAYYLGIAAAGAFAMSTSRTFDPTHQFGTYGPAFVPFVIGAALVILGLIGTIHPGPVPRTEEQYDLVRLLTAIAVMAAFVVLFRVLGFFLDTVGAAIALSILLVREHRWLSLAGIVGFVAATYLLMHDVLQVQFPSPSWLTAGLL